MDDLFDAHFVENGKRFTYRLTQDQSASIYMSIGEFLSKVEAAEGFDVTFREDDMLTGRERIQIFKLDATQAFTLYRDLGIYLQRRYPGSESRLHLHEVAS